MLLLLLHPQLRHQHQHRRLGHSSSSSSLQLVGLRRHLVLLKGLLLLMP
jgi:hypothetical protein